VNYYLLILAVTDPKASCENTNPQNLFAWLPGCLLACLPACLLQANNYNNGDQQSQVTISKGHKQLKCITEVPENTNVIDKIQCTLLPILKPKKFAEETPGQSLLQLPC